MIVSCAVHMTIVLSLSTIISFANPFCCCLAFSVKSNHRSHQNVNSVDHIHSELLIPPLQPIISSSCPRHDIDDEISLLLSSSLNKDDRSRMNFLISSSRTPLMPTAASCSTKRPNDNNNNNQHHRHHPTSSQWRQHSPVHDPSASSSSYLSMDLPVVYTNEPKIMKQWLDANVAYGKCHTIGFDVESLCSFYPSHRHRFSKFHTIPPSVIQLASTTSALVIQLPAIIRHGRRPSTKCKANDIIQILLDVLVDPTIIKAGVFIDPDILQFYERYPYLDARSRFDLSRLRSTSSYDDTSRDDDDNDSDDHNKSTKQQEKVPGLQTLTASILGLHLPKPKKIACSNWNRIPLSYSQLAYCARDAWVSAAIVHELAKRDVGTFGPDALRKQLRHQCRMNVIYRRHRKISLAKSSLSDILEPYRTNNHSNIPNNDIRNDSTANNSSNQIRYELPEKTKQHVKELRQVLTMKVHEPQPTYDIRSLGFSIDCNHKKNALRYK